jgi:hypothetical protein
MRTVEVVDTIHGGNVLKNWKYRVIGIGFYAKRLEQAHET